MLTRLHSRSAFSRSQFSKFIGATVPRLYAASVIGLHSLLSVKATDKSLGNSFIPADNRQGESRSGFFIQNKSHLFNGGACSSAFMHAATGIADFLDYKAPATRLGNGHGVSNSHIPEARHA